MRYTLLLAAILAAGSQASAQQRGSNVSEERVVVVSPAEKNRSKVVTRDGARTIEITLENNQVLEIKIDGKEAPRHSAKVENNHILLFAPGGRQEASIPFRWEPATTPPTGPVTRAWTGGVRPGTAAGGPGAAAGTLFLEGAATMDQGRRVIGITPTGASEALAAQFNLDPEKIIVVSSVTDGLPAAKAGVQRFDIITKIEGQPPATVVRLREALHAKGDEPVSLTVLRGGKELVLKVQGVPQEDVSMTWTASQDVHGTGRFMQRQPGQWMGDPSVSNEQRQRLEEAMARVREVGAQQEVRLAEVREQFTKRMTEMGQNLQHKFEQDGTLDEARKAYEVVVRELQSIDINEQIQRAMAELQRALGEVDIQRELRAFPEIRFMGRDDDRRDLMIVPSAPAAPAPPATASRPAQARPGATPTPPASAGEDTRLRALEERMARIERLLERIAENRGN